GKCDRSSAAPGYCPHHAIPLSQWRWLPQSVGSGAPQSGRWCIVLHTQQTAFSCPEKHTHVQRSIHGLEVVGLGGLLTTTLLLFVFCEAFTTLSPKSE